MHVHRNALAISSTLALLVAAGSGCQEYAVEQVLYTDEFQQGSDDSGVDILWVIDNSGTMSGEQERLGEAFAGITSMFEETVADFRLGVITTDLDDPEHRGRLQGDPAVLGPDTPDLATAFVTNAAVGTQGSKHELGFEALELAMTEAVDAGHNGGFFREDAILEVVVVSDEDDHGSTEVLTVMSDLTELVPDPERFRIHAIVGDEPYGCLTADSSAEAGSRYLAGARLSDGFDGSICLDDWTPLLEEIGLAVLGMQDTFALSKEPDVESLEVTVDGVLIPQRASDGWAYDIGLNAIVFDRYAVPRPGMAIVVSYFAHRG
ncbi:MAG: hypothetical protein QGH45_03550 [Myxococcota bacterium]|jgi:hypothetical protein|nr:hypothetical protein [Myxococcota bacterium]